MDCPSCAFALESQTLDGLTYHSCPLCHGVLVPTLASMQLWKKLEDADIAEPTEVIADAPQPTSCPKCESGLEAFGYMGSNLQVARCTPCRLLFVPGDRQAEARNLWRRQLGRAERRIERAAMQEIEMIIAQRAAVRTNRRVRSSQVASGRVSLEHEARRRELDRLDDKEG